MSHLCVALQGPLGLMKVTERGTLEMATGFRNWIDTVMATPEVTSVMLDVSDCTGLDSTFMGLMVSLGIRAMKSKRPLALFVVNASPFHRKLLDGIGVSRIWKYMEEKVPKLDHATLAEVARTASVMDPATRDIIIAAHQALMNVDENNIPKFKDVVELLSTQQ